MQQKSKTRAELLEKVLFLKGFSRIKHGITCPDLSQEKKTILVLRHVLYSVACILWTTTVQRWRKLGLECKVSYDSQLLFIKTKKACM